MGACALSFSPATAAARSIMRARPAAVNGEPRWLTRGWSVEARRSPCKAQLDKSRFMLLKGHYDLFQFILRKIDPVSLRQVWAAALERQIFVDKLFERF
jgi:hypothetical protein